MSKKLDDALYEFSGDGSESKEKIFSNISQKVNSPVTSKYRYRKHIAAAVSLCLIITIIGSFNVIASSINKIINTFFPTESVMMNEIGENTLQDIIDARISANHNMVDTEDVEDDGSLVYQILYKPVETPCYVYLHYYRGYLKTLTLDKNTKNIKEIEEWLKNNGGIIARVAGTPKEAAKLFEGNGAVSITPEKIREVMGDDCMLPDYLPDGKNNGNVIQYNEDFSTVNITYFCKGTVDFYPDSKKGKTPNYITLGIADINNKFGKNLTANLAVSKNIEISEINGWDVYISDGYYVWQTDGFAYVLYTTSSTHEEIIKIIENMK